MKNKMKNVGLWTLTSFMFLFVVYALSGGSILGAILFAVLGMFISPLRVEIFKKFNLPSLKGVYIFLISTILFLGACVSIPSTVDTSADTINELNSRIEEISAEKDSLNAKVSELNDKLKSDQEVYQSKQEEYEEILKEKEEQVKVQESQIAELHEQLLQSDDYQGQIDTLTAENNNLKNEISELQQQANAKLSTGSEDATVISSSSSISNSVVGNDDITVYITKTGEKYHSSGCRYLSKSKISISKSDAIRQGYDACSVCNP